MSRRRLRPDELALWRRVAAKTDPLHPDRPPPNAAPAPPAFAPRQPPKPPALPAGFAIGVQPRAATVVDEVLPGLAGRAVAESVRMDSKAYARLRRGKLKPEARIDLHGMTLAQARPALTAFILTAHARQRRLVLVITGKGKRGADPGPIPVRPGALRHEVPLWLRLPPLPQSVLQVVQAHARHGGEGAWYVYLRRK